MNLVTGATGLMGAHICAALIQRGERVAALVRNEGDLGALPEVLRLQGQRLDSVEVIPGDITDLTSLDRAMRGVDQVFHCAAMVSFNASRRWDMMEVNAGGTANVVNQCIIHQVSTLVYLSSTSALGEEPEGEVVSESSKWTTDRGKSGYALSKRYAELEVQRARQEGLKSIILNPAVIIGPGKWGQSSTSMIVAAEKGMKFYPTGANAFVDVRDVADFALHAVEGGLFEGRYILCGGNHSFKAVFEWATEAYGSARPSVAMPAWLGRAAAKALQALELAGIDALKITAQSIRAAYRKMVFSNERARSTGFEFRPVKEAVRYAVEARQSTSASSSSF